ncbi:hypothetical protein CC85DRAFT_81857 [Cutaneotrichosporon oleaginosum]|uniref:Uncharacterized protein n=1 Tax=Cutaneotrichosporon oleaginosum TaxID=879819 RepID=A0A0J0XNL0_9TREE|nr:uncharacterized protein CC85DRAFT_81857 [Cutaneotrichosporon oleaginosum]KLT42663.1 hypothetical protein CC85DRAFT_81857 [Cutaneotrichosporon oleaginosum]TXT05221.1 hypothetical protein COLE_06541 [Cutaneotrichosporon oleaginosum]
MSATERVSMSREAVCEVRMRVNRNGADIHSFAQALGFSWRTYVTAVTTDGQLRCGQQLHQWPSGGERPATVQSARRRCVQELRTNFPFSSSSPLFCEHLPHKQCQFNALAPLFAPFSACIATLSGGRRFRTVAATKSATTHMEDLHRHGSGTKKFQISPARPAPGGA